MELSVYSFEKLDYGVADVLDRFYNADIAFVDMSVETQQNALFYHIGVRESVGKPVSVILRHDVDTEFTISPKVRKDFE